jgi:hypothetical protein
MNRSILFLVSLLMTTGVLAQAYESSIQYDKKKQAAIAIDYRYSPEAVENAVVRKLTKLGYKAKEEKGILNRDKGFLVYKNIYVTDISQNRMDYLVKVERKSKKESDESVLYLVIMKGDQNALNTMNADDVDNAKNFLNDMLDEVEEASLDLEIKGQETIVAKAEKKLSDLQKDRKELEEKLEKNIKDQEDTSKDIENQKQTLEILRGKRKKD